MKMYKKTIYLIIPVVIFTSCLKLKDAPNDKFSYDNLKSKDYNLMSTDEQSFFKVQLTQSLRKDSNVVNLNKSVESIAALSLSRNKAMYEKNKNLPVPLNGNDALKYYAAIGIKAPMEYLTAKVLLMRSILLIKKNHPEFNKLPSDVRQKVLASASSQSSFGTVMKK
jgi:hypothetical protein